MVGPLVQSVPLYNSELACSPPGLAPPKVIPAVNIPAAPTKPLAVLALFPAVQLVPSYSKLVLVSGCAYLCTLSCNSSCLNSKTT